MAVHNFLQVERSPMPRRPKTTSGPSRLSGILAQITKQPRLELKNELKSLKLSYKSKNGDFGARSTQLREACASANEYFLNHRYFVKEELPRIRYVRIRRLRSRSTKCSPVNLIHKPPTMVLEFSEHILTFPYHHKRRILKHASQQQTLLHTLSPSPQKWSTTILAELMSSAGTAVWSKWVRRADRSRRKAYYQAKRAT